VCHNTDVKPFLEASGYIAPLDFFGGAGEFDGHSLYGCQFNGLFQAGLEHRPTLLFVKPDPCQFFEMLNYTEVNIAANRKERFTV
jgi:hypothetical protein